MNNIIIRGKIATDPLLTIIGETRKVHFAVPLYTGRDNPPLWFRVEAWDELADEAKGYRKGDTVVVEGHTKHYRYVKDGETRDSFNITATQIRPVEWGASINCDFDRLAKGEAA